MDLSKLKSVTTTNEVTEVVDAVKENETAKAADKRADATLRVFDPWSTIDKHNRADISRLLLNPDFGGIDPAQHQRVFNFCAGIYAKVLQEGLAPTIELVKEIAATAAPEMTYDDLIVKVIDWHDRAVEQLATPTQQ